MAPRWRLSFSNRKHELEDPASSPRFAAGVLAFHVANGHLRGGANVQPRCADDEVSSIGWVDGERALILEIDVPRSEVRKLRISGPSGLAWALFDPGTDADWRPRASASAVGFAAGTSQVKLRPGVWALVLFHDPEEVRAGSAEIVFEIGRA